MSKVLIDADTATGLWGSKDQNPSQWAGFLRKLKEKKLVILDEALREVHEVNDEVYDLLKANRIQVLSMNQDLQEITRQILENYPTLVNPFLQSGQSLVFSLAASIAFDLPILALGKGDARMASHPDFSNVLDTFKVRMTRPQWLQG